MRASLALVLAVALLPAVGGRKSAKQVLAPAGPRSLLRAALLQTCLVLLCQT